MATNTLQLKFNQTQQQQDQEEEEEALSLCDLPLTFINHPTNDEFSQSQINGKQQEFDFRSWSGFFSKEPEMCVADEVFFQGQILPSRLSFSSEAGLLTSAFHPEPKQFTNRNESRSKSLDHASLSEIRSSNSSSRSSSIRSQNSSTSTSSTTMIKPRIRNQFHTHPSPKPQLKSSAPKQASLQGNRKSSAWEIFRLGVVPFPEIELQDLKARNKNNCVSRNSSNSSSSSNNSVKRSNKNNNHFVKQLVGKSGGLLSGCDCSFEEAVQPEKVIMIKKTESRSATHAMKEKVKELKKQEGKKKKVMSRRRTFEWLKELHANHDQEEQALLSSKNN